MPSWSRIRPHNPWRLQCASLGGQNVLAEHAGVKEVAVVGFTKWREGEEIAAFVVPSVNLTEAE